VFTEDGLFQQRTVSSQRRMTPEAAARQEIDEQLVACGWHVQDLKNVDFSAGRGIALREVQLTTGPCDYLLLVDRRAVGVIEAKKEGTTLSAVADQSDRYADSLPGFLSAGQTGRLPFLYESTGVETLFRDARDPDPRSRRVFTFHRPETLGEWMTEPPYAQRLTEPMLKELEKKLRDTHATWTEDRLWDAFAVTAPAKVKGRSQPGRFADLVSLVRFALEQQPVLEPFSDSVASRFDSWMREKDQEALTKDKIKSDQVEGLAKAGAHQLFGDGLPKLLDQLNSTPAAET
jgi:hypothetical protein